MKKKFWEYFENLNEYVYAADIETYDLVYMNKKLKEFCLDCLPQELKKIASADPAAYFTGKKCYEVLQHCAMPCQICNNGRLELDQFCEWWLYHPVWKKHLLVKNTLIREEGRTYRIEFATDVGTQEWSMANMQNYENIEALANEAIRLALQAATPDGSIAVILEYLGKALQGERTYVFEKNENGCDDNTYEWVAKGVRPEKAHLQNVPAEVCASWYRKFQEGKNIIIEDLEDIRTSDPLQYDILKQQDIHSLVVVPLYNNGTAIGFYGVDNPSSKDYLEYVSNILQTMAHFILSSINRRNLVRQLQTLGYQDQLTGIGNRRAMWEYCKPKEKDQSFGVVYCDITGLKEVNDTKGHTAGDQLICDSCDCLKEIFGTEGLFRIGGDEFVVLCPAIEEALLSEKIEQLKACTKEKNITLATGFAWSPKCPDDLETILSAAEKVMYADKRAYYQARGVDRRNRRS